MTFPQRLLDALNYNEKKVEKGIAHCIGANGYIPDPGKMNFYQKFYGMESRNALNDSASTKTMHVSLNFDPSEKFSKETLHDIANHYMQKIGFEDQPYMVYQHIDAGHPHIHIVSSLIREDGSRIATHNLGKNQSERARREIEQRFGLVRADRRRVSQHNNIQTLPLEKITYGKSETRRGIEIVVDRVFRTYQFTSLAQFNAALRQFNVTADPGKEGGRISQHRGLVYRIINEKGEKVGVPIKASLLPSKPTLFNLEKRFEQNEKTRLNHAPSLQQKLDVASHQSSSLGELITCLQKLEVYTLPRRSADGRLYGITFVDNQTRSVFNGSELGKQYAAAGLDKHFAISDRKEFLKDNSEVHANKPTVNKEKELSAKMHFNQPPNGMIIPSGQSDPDPSPPTSYKKKKRRKKKQIPRP